MNILYHVFNSYLPLAINSFIIYVNMLRLKYKILTLLFMTMMFFALSPSLVKAVACPDGFDGGSINQIENGGSCDDHRTGGPEADSVEARQAAADPSRGADLNADCDDKGNCCESDNLTKDNCTIVGYIVTLVNILSGLVGLVVVVMIAYGGIRYSASGDNPQETAAAKAIIRNAIIALVTYIFSFAFLQYIIPGGLF